MTNPFGGAVDVIDDDGLGDEAPRIKSGEARPRVRDMFGRTVLVVAKKVETVPGTDGDYDRLTADVHVIDGGTLHYGGSPEDPEDPQPHTTSVEAPHVFPGLWISNRPIVDEMRDSVKSGKPKGGHFDLGEKPADKKRKRPLVLRVAEKGTEERAKVAAYWKQYQAKGDDGLA